MLSYTRFHSNFAVILLGLCPFYAPFMSWLVQLVVAGHLKSLMDQSKSEKKYRKEQKLKKYSLHDKQKVIDLIEKDCKICDIVISFIYVYVLSSYDYLP